jgi:hypothetical protein
LYACIFQGKERKFSLGNTNGIRRIIPPKKFGLKVALSQATLNKNIVKEKKMNKKQKISAIGTLLCSSCLAVSVGVAALNVSAQTTTTPITSLVSVEGEGVTVSNKTFNATHYTKSLAADVNNGTAYTYSGLTVESDSAYTGKFAGVFTDDTTLEYKFPGKNPWKSNKMGTNIGDFHFTITSVANPTQWVQMNIEGKNKTSFTTCTYFTGSTFGTGVWATNGIGTMVNTKTQDYINNTWKTAGYGPSFLSDSISENEKLYIEVDDAGAMYISYQQWSQGTNGVCLENYRKESGQVKLDGSNTGMNAKMDWSEGYTISFSSNVEKTTYAYSTSSYENTDGGSDVCFISLNGNALNTDTVSIESESIAMLGDTVLNKDSSFDVFQNSAHELYSVKSGEVYGGDYTCLDGGAKNGSFVLQSKTDCGALKTDELGDNQSVEIDGVSYSYNVVSGTKGTDLIGINVDGASAAYKAHTGDNVASAYDGLTIEAANSYTGSFDGVFNGNTALEYKFPGTTSVNSKGDALGDFYFTIISVADPTQWIQINITQTYVSASTAYHATQSLIYATTSLAQIPENAWALRSGFTKPHCQVQDNVRGWSTLAPTFRSDAVAATESLYIETDEETGFSYVYYQTNGSANGTKTYPIIGFEKFDLDNDGKYEENKDSSFDNYVTDLFDFSKGYTISFGSNFDKEQSFVKLKAGTANEYEAYTGELPDAGTDVCFISVNGVSLSDELVKTKSLNYKDEVSFDGELVEGAVDLSNAEGKTFDVTTTVSSTENYTVAELDCPLNYSKTASNVAWNSEDVVDGKLTLESDVFGGREVVVSVLEKAQMKYTLIVNGVSTEKTTTAEKVVLETQALDGKVFMGWTISGLENKLYPANYEYTVVDGDTLTAVFVAFDMADGAGIRKTAPYGLRFVSGYNTADFAAISEYATVGTLIVPTDTLNGKEINHTNFTANETMLDIAGAKLLSAEAAQKALSEEDYSADNTYYTGTISDLKEANFARKFSARAYIMVTYADGTETYFYSDYDETNNARSAYDVAKAAQVNNETGDAIELYINQTMDLSDITDVDTTEYESATKITSVRVNNVWISATAGAVVKVGEKNYTVTYDYDETNAKLVLTFNEVVE